jgi:SAM-dependent MidA family methyltransferase
MEVRVGLSADEASFVEHLVPSAIVPLVPLVPLVPDAQEGDRVPIQDAAAEWLREALARSRRVVAIDYCVATTAELARRPMSEWLRTYRRHERGGPPLTALGEQDITCEVAVDQLARVRPPESDVTQAGWLRHHGLDELVEEGRAVWAERAAAGDLAAVRARSRITEAGALTDPAGLGAFRVLEWRTWSTMTS